MAYIGRQPTAAALTASDVADGIISNAKLAQDIISADTALGAEPADTDEFLVSDAGTLKRMDYSHIKAAAGLVKIENINVTSAATTIDFDGCFSATYDNYVMIGFVRPSTSGHIYGRQVHGATPTYITGSVYQSYGAYWHSTDSESISRPGPNKTTSAHRISFVISLTFSFVKVPFLNLPCSLG